MIVVQDSLYGCAVEINEAVLVELVTKCPAIDRLRGVLQHGISDVIGTTPSFSRFDHSVGASKSAQGSTAGGR